MAILFYCELREHEINNTTTLIPMKKIFLSEKIILTAIIANAIVIFWMSFPDWRNHNILKLIDDFFIFFFLIEAIVKITTLNSRAYFSDKWNRFDFALVVGSTPALLTAFLPIPNTSILLIFRLLRLVRLVKFLWFIPNMKHILLGLGRAFKASIFVLLALVFLNLLLSIVSCQLFGEKSPTLFGTPITASYTIFQMFTVEGWNEIVTQVEKSDATHTAINIAGIRIYFVIVVLFGGIFGMSLANAIFVDEMTIDNNIVLEEKIDALREKIEQLQHILEEKP